MNPRTPFRVSLAALFALTLVLGVFGTTAAQDAASPEAAGTIEIKGAVAHPGHWSVADLQALPSETVEIDYLTDNDVPQHHSFTGVRLWDVLQLTVSADDPPGKALSPLASYLVIQAKDGYFVVFSMAEIAPDFGHQPYLLVWEMDGQPLSDAQRPLMLVAPGDTTDGRFIYGITILEVRSVTPDSAG